MSFMSSSNSCQSHIYRPTPSHWLTPAGCAIRCPVLSQILLIIRRVASYVSMYSVGLLVFCTSYSCGLPVLWWFLCTLYSGGLPVCCTPYSVLYTLVVSLYSVLCTLYSVLCTLYSGQPPMSSYGRRFDDSSKRLNILLMRPLS